MGTKWSDSGPAEKLLSFYTMLLFSRTPISLSDAASSLDCSKQTVGRLANQLEGSRYGKLNKSKIGKEVYFSMDKPKRLPAMNLNAEALADLALCYEFIQKLLPPSILHKSRQGLSQAAAFFPESETSIKDGIAYSLAKGPIDYEPFVSIMRNFMLAITEKRICSIVYKAKRHQEEKKHEFAPKRLIAFRESIFVLGYFVTEENPPKQLYPNPTLLAIHRFKSCEIERRKSDNIPEPQISEESFLGIYNEKQFPITVRFSADAATYVAERKWSRKQWIEDLPNNDIILHAEASNEKECIAWILSFGHSAQLLEPPWLREKIGNLLVKMVSMYSEKY